MSLRTRIAIALVIVAVWLALVLGAGFLHETLGLPTRTIGYFAALLLIAAVVAILWSATLRDWVRRPGGGKNDKQRS